MYKKHTHHLFKITSAVLLCVVIGFLFSKPLKQFKGENFTGQFVSCGNGLVDFAEQCDDNNTEDGDGCDSDCNAEYGYTCSGEPSICETVCGDGAIAGEEFCDDGNSTAGDGCSNTCTIEAGFSCENEPSDCYNCGNGVIEYNEQCDDNNTIDGDGCDSACVVEYPYICSGEPSVCEIVCGDAIISGDEECDAGDTIDGDGCSSTCTIESGYICFDEPSTCEQTCGNGMINFGEQCDDGLANSDVNPDVCRTTCALPTCGDSVIDSGEECDDDNTIDGDGCSSSCTLEVGGICGDGIVGGLEDCDDGAENSNTVPGACRTDCTQQLCGDGIVDPNEECDDGVNNSDTEIDACRTTCQVAYCGDGSIDTGEQCDDGNQRNTDGCLNTCIPAVCGDGYVNTLTERCEPPNVEGVCNAFCRAWEGNSGGGGTRSSSSQEKVYTSQPTVEQYGCGNMLVEPDLGEECDDGISNGLTNCSEECTLLSCGDGIVSPQLNEECEPPVFTNKDGDIIYNIPECGTFCVPPNQEGFGADDYCTRTEIVSCEEEEKDPEELEETQKEYCGNGVVEPGEQCDSGGVCQGGSYDQMIWSDSATAKACFDGGGIPEALDGDGCNTQCMLEVCGDGIVQSRGADGKLGTTDDEQCDNGRICAMSGKACNTNSDCGSGDQCIFNILKDETCNPRCKAKQCQYSYKLALPEYDASTHRLKLTVTDERGVSAVDATIFSIGDNVQSALPPPEVDEDEESSLTASLFNWRSLIGQVSRSISTTVTTDVSHYVQGVDAYAQIACTVYNEEGNKICDLPPSAFKLELDGKVIEDAVFTEVDTGFCGDGVRQINEECDDGNKNNDDSCTTKCKATTFDEVKEDEVEIRIPITESTEECGNGQIEGIEQCDDGNDLNGDGCSNLCQTEERCGDGTVQQNEECDDGNSVSNDGCSAGCVVEKAVETSVQNIDPVPIEVTEVSCGDGTIDINEECDNGSKNRNAPDACRTSCTLPVCGDGILDSTEQCDLGSQNKDEANSCKTNCRLPTCGDGFKDRGEECDSTANCSAICTRLYQAVCGNGIREEQEECDDGNSDNYDGCSSLCSVEVSLKLVAECGNGVREPGEECDDGNMSSADACSNICTIIEPIVKSVAITPLEQTVNHSAAEPVTRLPLAMVQPIASPVYSIAQTGPGMALLLVSGVSIGVSVVRRKQSKQKP